MEAHFWHQKWEKNDIAFHEPQANPALVKYAHQLLIIPGSRVFVPLCGKTRDIAWLLSHGYCVAGVELSPRAIEQLFLDLGVSPQISDLGKVKHYRASQIDILCGNIFDVTQGMLGKIDAIYDRAALVALPKDMRIRYVEHIMDITHKAPQLLINYEYDQAKMEGPPFSITSAEVRQYYSKWYELNLLETTDVPGGLKGQCPAKEHVWLLVKQRRENGKSA